MADIMRMGKNPNYLGSWDLEELPGKEAVLTIAQIKDEEVVTNGQKEICTTIHWTDKTFKPMVMNVTNKKTLCRLYKTKDTEKLCGRSVIIGIDKVKAFGDIYDALRIRPKVPQSQSTVKPKCEKCGKDIHSYGSMTPEQVAAYAAKKYGQKLCAECGAAMAKGAEQ